MRQLVAVVIAAAALAVAAPAMADEGPGKYSPVAADDPRARGLQGAALEYWRRQGVAACATGVSVFYADVPALGVAGKRWEWDATAGTWVLVPGCWAILDDGWVAMLRDTDTRGRRRWLARIECNGWAHEIGHALGLGHDDEGAYPVMAPAPTGLAVRECNVAARAMYPPRKHRRRSQAKRR